MRQRTTIIVNLLTNQGSVVIDTLINLFILGFLTQNMSESGFGLVVIALSLPAVFELLGASLNKGTVRNMAVANEQNNRPLTGGLVATSLLLYTGLGLLCGLAALWLSLDITRFFAIPDVYQNDAEWSFGVVAIGVVVCFPLNVFRGALFAAQKHYMVNLCRSTPILLRGIAIPTAFWLWGPSVTSVIAITFGCRFLERLSWYVAYRISYRGIRTRLQGMGKVALKMLLGFSVLAVMIDVGNIMGYEAYKYLIGAKMSLADAGVYGLYAALVAYSGTMARTAADVLMPVASKYTERGDAQTTHEVLLQGTKMTVLLNLLFCVACLPLIRPLLSLWAGETMAEPWLIAALLLTGQNFVGYGTCAGVLLAGAGRQTYLAITTMACFSVGLAVAYSLTLSGPVSLMAIAWTIVISRSLNGVLRLEYATRHLSSRPWQVISRGIFLPTLVAIGTAAIVWLATRPFVIDNWLELSAASAFLLLVYTILGILFCFTREERATLRQLVTMRRKRADLQ